MVRQFTISRYVTNLPWVQISLQMDVFIFPTGSPWNEFKQFQSHYRLKFKNLTKLTRFYFHDFWYWEVTTLISRLFHKFGIYYNLKIGMISLNCLNCFTFSMCFCRFLTPLSLQYDLIRVSNASSWKSTCSSLIPVFSLACGIRYV